MMHFDIGNRLLRSGWFQVGLSTMTVLLFAPQSAMAEKSAPEIIGDRPDFTESSATIPPLHLQGELGLAYSSNYKSHQGIRLTPAGTRVALYMVRRHRLIEQFLVTALEYGWDEVHDEAHRLEHCVSPTFVDRIDRFLQHPKVDPKVFVS